MTKKHPLIEYARQNGISMDALAKEAGTSRTTLYRIIEGEQNATVGLLQRIVNATKGEVTLASLLPKAASSRVDAA